MKKQAGFSLVELVIVIIVVGLLAVAALPRFLNVTDEAKKAQIEGVAGSYATAVLSARAQWEAEGRPSDIDGKNSVNYDGTIFMLSAENTKDEVRSGYPIYAGQKNNAAIGSIGDKECKGLFEQLLQNPPQVVAASEKDVFSGDYQYAARKDAKGNNTVCEFVQLASAATSGSDKARLDSAHSFTYTPKQGSVVVNIQ